MADNKPTAPAATATVPSIADLLDYLAKSGTGKGKLDAINAAVARAGFKTVNKDFLAVLPKLLPSGTLAKVERFMESQK